MGNVYYHNFAQNNGGIKGSHCQLTRNLQQLLQIEERSSKMKTNIRLVKLKEETNLAPLGVLGYCLTRSKFYEPLWAELRLPLKQVDHAPEAKLLDILVSILSGCRALVQVNTRIRPDLALARAWGREQFAEQSTLARTLDCFCPTSVAHLQNGSNRLFRRESRLLRHDFAQQWLWLDVDLTPLPISKRAEGSTKGKIGGEKTRMVASWRASKRRSTMRRSCRTSIRGASTAVQHTFPCSLR